MDFHPGTPAHGADWPRGMSIMSVPNIGSWKCWNCNLRTKMMFPDVSLGPPYFQRLPYSYVFHRTLSFVYGDFERMGHSWHVLHPTGRCANQNTAGSTSGSLWSRQGSQPLGTDLVCLQLRLPWMISYDFHFSDFFGCITMQHFSFFQINHVSEYDTGLWCGQLWRFDYHWHLRSQRTTDPCAYSCSAGLVKPRISRLTEIYWV